MEFYFMNKKIKNIHYCINKLNADEYKYFVIEIVLILSKLNKNIGDGFDATEWNTLLLDIKKNMKLLNIFNKISIKEIPATISCGIDVINSPDTIDSYYYFELY